MMKENYKIKQLEIDDVKDFVRIIRESFQSHHLVPSIYRGKGVEQFIINEMDNIFSPYKYFVAYHNNQVVGSAEFKVFAGSNTFFLNMIASEKEFKGKGIGKSILNFAVDFFVRLGYENFQLDVYQDNNVALNWYLTLGFKQMEYKSLYKVNTKSYKLEEQRIYIQNYPQYKINKDSYGFNYIDVVSHNESMRIGVIGDDLIFRGEYRDTTKIIAKILHDSLYFKNIYFIGKDNMTNRSELIFMNNIIRMELKLKDDYKDSSQN